MYIYICHMLLYVYIYVYIYMYIYYTYIYIHISVYIYINIYILVTHSYMHVIYACLYNICFLNVRSSKKSPGPPEMPDSEKAATHLRDLGDWAVSSPYGDGSRYLFW